MRSILTPIIFLFFIPCWCQAQNQLVLIKREKVLAHFSEEHAFTYKLKGAKKFTTDYLVRIQEFSVITSSDTILFSEIDKIYLKDQGSSFMNRIGTVILSSGIIYFISDQFNSVLHGNGYDNDKAVWKPALILVGSGTILKMIRKRSQRLQYPAKLLVVHPGTPFYKPDK